MELSPLNYRELGVDSSGEERNRPWQIQERRKKQTHNSNSVAGLIAEPTGTDRNRRASASLSPVLIHFISPSSYLSQKLQQVLTQLHTNGNTALPLITTRRPGPAKPKHGIPPTEWPTVQRRVLENQEPLRQVASDYGVSHETVRRVLLALRKKDVG